MRPRLSYCSVLYSALKTDRRLRRFIFFQCTYQTGAAAVAFFAVYGLEKFALPTGTAGTFTVLFMAGSVAGGLLLGRLGARRG